MPSILNNSFDATVIIPYYNADLTIKECLKELSKVNKKIEVILIDDFSKTPIPHTPPITKLIRLDKNKGPSYARNEGIKNSSSNNLLFIDSDVIVPYKDVEYIINKFKTNPDFNSFTTQVDVNHPQKNFWSTFKNLYLQYIFSKTDGHTRHFYGSFCGFRKETNLKWPNKIRIGEDTALGAIAISRGIKIHFLKEIKIIHLKTYSLISLIQNDFTVPFFFSKIFLKAEKKNNFSHTSNNQLFAIATTSLLPISFLCPQLLFVFFPFFLFFNWGFIHYLKEQKGFSFQLKSTLFLIIDEFVMGLGVFFGLIFFKTKSIISSKE